MESSLSLMSLHCLSNPHKQESLLINKPMYSLLVIFFIILKAYSQWIAKLNTHNIIGWYHSHPNFGCWLSGIDVNTTEIFQRGLDPFFALVVDPIKSANLSTFFK